MAEPIRSPAASNDPRTEPCRRGDCVFRFVFVFSLKIRKRRRVPWVGREERPAIGRAGVAFLFFCQFSQPISIRDPLRVQIDKPSDAIVFVPCFTEFYRVFLRFFSFYWVLPNVIMGFILGNRDFIGFY